MVVIKKNVTGMELWRQATISLEENKHLEKKDNACEPSLDKQIEWARQQEAVELDRFLQSNEGIAACRLLTVKNSSIMIYDNTAREENIRFTGSGMVGRYRKPLAFKNPHEIVHDMSLYEVVKAAYTWEGCLRGRRGWTLLEYIIDQLNSIAEGVLKKQK